MSNIAHGGAIQVASSVLTEFHNFHDYNFIFVLSKKVLSSFQRIEKSNIKIYHYEIKNKFLKTFIKRDIFLDGLCEKHNINCVLTIFGPSYWVPSVPHLMGFARGHHIYQDSVYFSTLDIYEKIKLKITRFFHKINMSTNNNYYWCETHDVKERLSKYLKVDLSKIYVISNTYHPVFDRVVTVNPNYKSVFDACKGYFIFLTVSAYYPHKNLEILRIIIPILRKQKISCKFFITIDEDNWRRFFGFEDYIVNLGPVDIKYLPQLYNLSNAVFFPSLLECFSAVYPEAMKTKLPIITSDMSFAKSICDNAALYFDPLSPESIVEKIIIIIADENLRHELVKNGEVRLKTFKGSTQRATELISLCESMIHERAE